MIDFYNKWANSSLKGYPGSRSRFIKIILDKTGNGETCLGVNDIIRNKHLSSLKSYLSSVKCLFKIITDRTEQTDNDTVTVTVNTELTFSWNFLNC